MSASFPHFGRLPPEIRRHIWSFSMPRDGPALAAYGARWELQFIDPNHRLEEIRNLDRRLLVQVAVPAALSVNREARECASAWIAKNQLTWESNSKTKTRVLVRDWDAQKDIIYVSRDWWEEFSSHMEEIENNDEAFVHKMGASITHLALPAFTAYYSINTLGSMMDWMPNLRYIYSVWGELPKAPRHSIAPPEGAPPGPFDSLFKVDQWEWEEVDPENNVKMCCIDPMNGDIQWEEGKLSEYLDDIADEWSINEGVPDRFMDMELGIVDMPYVHVTIKDTLRTE